MSETTTLDDLSLRVLGADLVNAIPDAEVTVLEPSPESMTLDELSRRVLKPEVNQSLPEIDLQVKQADFLLQARDLCMEARLRGVSLTVLLAVGIATVMCNGAIMLLALLLRGN